MVILNEKFEVPSLRELLQVRKTKAQWDSKTPLQKWGYLYSVGRVSLNILGFPVFRDDPSLYWFSYIFFVYMGIDIVLVFFTAYKCLLMDNGFAIFLPCTALLVGPLLCVGLIIAAVNVFFYKLFIPISRVLRWAMQVLQVQRLCFTVWLILAVDIFIPMKIKTKNTLKYAQSKLTELSEVFA